MSEHAYEDRDLDFSIEEVTVAIKLLKQGKAPGPDMESTRNLLWEQYGWVAD